MNIVYEFGEDLVENARTAFTMLNSAGGTMCYGSRDDVRIHNAFIYLIQTGRIDRTETRLPGRGKLYTVKARS